VCISSLTAPANSPQQRAALGWSVMANAIMSGQGNQAAKSRLKAFRGVMTQRRSAQPAPTGGPASVTGV
jgi:hypothetical protein